MELLLLTLAVFGVWEAILALVPWTIPAWLQPFIVTGIALGATWPDLDPRLALAVMGAVGLLHVAVRAQTSAVEPQIVRRRETRVPTLP